MPQNEGSQLSRLLDHAKPDRVRESVKKIFAEWYPSGDFAIVDYVFRMVERLFKGFMPGYRACNTEYHNLGHTMDCLVASARLMDGFNLTRGRFSLELAQDLLIAALIHDTGYIQEKGDDIGTGAKYTRTHVDRSVDFLIKNSRALRVPAGKAEAIARIVRGTGLAVKWEDIHFADEMENTAGAILGTADLLGQMADRQYLEKLLFLYYEFREAGVPGYSTEFDILKNTLAFYETTRSRLDNTLSGVYSLASAYFEKRHNINRNLYIESIENQMAYLRSILEDSSSNFRTKLKRMDMDQAEMRYKVS